MIEKLCAGQIQYFVYIDTIKLNNNILIKSAVLLNSIIVFRSHVLIEIGIDYL